MPANTPRRGLPYPLDSEPPDGPAQIGALALALDRDAEYDQGALSARPVSTPASPGVAGRLYLASPENVLYLDRGTSWLTLNPALVADGPAGTATLRSLGPGAQQAAAGSDPRLSDQRTPRDASVTLTKIASPLRPSQGASNTVETLRAIGGAAGQVVAGTDARMVNQRTPLDGSVTAAKIASDAVGLDKLAPLPRCVVSGSGVFADGLEANMSYQSESIDTHGMFSAASPSVVTTQHLGLWRLNGYISWAGNAAGARQLALVLNGFSFRFSSAAPISAGFVTAHEVSGLYYLGPGVTFGLRATQASTGVNLSANWTLSAVLLGP